MKARVGLWVPKVGSWGTGVRLWGTGVGLWGKQWDDGTLQRDYAALD